MATAETNLAAVVHETGRPARIDNYPAARGALADDIREAGIRSAVGTPIVVEDRVWGLMVARFHRGAGAGAGYRGAPRAVHGAGGDGDRQHRSANRGGAAR